MNRIKFESLHEVGYECPQCFVLELSPLDVLCASLTGANAEGISEEDYFESIW